MSKQPSLSELVARSNKRFCRPGFIKKRLHARGESAVYLSEDKKFIIIDRPDGTITKKPFKRLVPLKPEQDRSTRKKRDVRPKSKQDQSAHTGKRPKSTPTHPH